jgi:hypothetical protein
MWLKSMTWSSCACAWGFRRTSRVSASRARLWVGAFTGFYKPGVEEVRSLDAVSRFLYAARSVILVISAQAAIIAGLLAAAAGHFAWVSFLGVLIGFLVAHMISNLSNDDFGFRRGHDTPDSPRMRYTVHPLASGVLEKRTLLTGLAIWSSSASPSRRTLSLNAAGWRRVLPRLVSRCCFYTMPHQLRGPSVY